MEDQNKNLILATVLSFLVILVWFIGGPMLFPSWFPTEQTAPTELTALPADVAPPAAATSTGESLDAPVATEAPRVMLDTPKLSGSISMLGGRLDDLSLKTYRETVGLKSDNVQLLSSAGSAVPYYAVFAFQPGDGLESGDVPGFSTLWQAVGGSLTPDSPVTLTWQNGKGLAFTRTVAVDENFMFTVTDKIDNTGTATANLAPISVIARRGLPELENIFVVHEGIIRRTDGILEESNYSALTDLPELEGALGEKIEAATDGWIGFTDHYWMTTLIPEQGNPFTAVTKFTPSPVAGSEIYQVEIRQPVLSVAPGGSASECGLYSSPAS